MFVCRGVNPVVLVRYGNTENVQMSLSHEIFKANSSIVGALAFTFFFPL